MGTCGDQIQIFIVGKTFIQHGSSHWTKIDFSDCRCWQLLPTQCCVSMSEPHKQADSLVPPGSPSPFPLPLQLQMHTSLTRFTSTMAKLVACAFTPSGHLFHSPGKLPNNALPSLHYHIICFCHNYLWTV